MDKKFLLIVKNNNDYKVIEYLYTKKVISLDIVEKDILESIIACWFELSSDFKVQGLIEVK